ncbi:MAG: FtsH protease activity modulator HflK [Clostridia bacterium]|nr:FtsH protease activity modulator HflK [Clostridia bacterium]
MRVVYQNEKEKKPKEINLSASKLRRMIIIGIVVLALVVCVFTGFYTTNEQEQAVVTTFGKVTEVVESPGLHFKLPFGIQGVQKVPVKVHQKIELGYRSETNAAPDHMVSVEDESKMITGDYNIVNVDFFVEYKISDPVKYLYNSYEPTMVLKNLVQSQVRSVIGATEVDAVLTTGRNEVERQAKELITELLVQYDIGVVLTDLKIQDSEPPTPEVIEAFKAVETAKQQAETVINQAKAYQNSMLPKADAEADKLTKDAEYQKQQRINEAMQQVALFNARYNEYAKNPEITRSRMYYEELQQILPDVKLIIDAGEGDSTKYILIEDFLSIADQENG